MDLVRSVRMHVTALFNAAAPCDLHACHRRAHSGVGCCYVARLHVSLVSHHTSLPFQPATRRATSLSAVQQTSNRYTCPGAIMTFVATVKICKPVTTFVIIKVLYSSFYLPCEIIFINFVSVVSAIQYIILCYVPRWLSILFEYF